MSNEHDREGSGRQSGIIGSLRDALAAASRDDTTRNKSSAKPTAGAAATTHLEAANMASETELEGGARSPLAAQQETDGPPPLPTAAEAARDARGGTPNIPPVADPADRHVEFEAPPTTGVVRQAAATVPSQPARTRLVRGRPQVERGEFQQDPVTGWLVVVGGPGIGAFRPIYEGNNTIGRSSANRVAIDFGDDTISSEEQAYIRYDSASRNFLFVPNMSKTNIVSVNDDQPTSAVPLHTKDVIRMGKTQLVFVAFCGQDFDWAELQELNKG